MFGPQYDISQHPDYATMIFYDFDNMSLPPVTHDNYRRPHQRQNSAPTLAGPGLSHPAVVGSNPPLQAALAAVAATRDSIDGQMPKTPTRRAKTSNFPMTPGTTPLKRSADFIDQGRAPEPSPTKRQKHGAYDNAPQSAPLQRARSLQGVVGPFPPRRAAFGDLDSLDLPMSPLGYGRVQGFEKAPKVAIPPATPLLPKLGNTSHAPPAAKAALSPRATSLGDLGLDANFDATIEETGITLDEIAAYIQGPDPTDNRWVCTYEDCGKRFGRKENIKSHVQTHLGDRQFKCNHCNKCFVRAHDLKRHAKIHTGVKPYHCNCGNTFARQDALTRHRQRGMCIGAFDGAVKKDMKRGRPKKTRPEMGERQNKASRARQNAAERADRTSSPESTDGLGSRETSVGTQNSGPMDPTPSLPGEGYGLPPNVFTFTPPSSPGNNAVNKLPRARNVRTLTPTMEADALPISPSKNVLTSIQEEEVDLSMTPLAPNTHRRDSSFSSTDFTLSPSPTAPTLIEASSSSDFGRFTSRETTLSFDEGQLPAINGSNLPAFPESNNSLPFDQDLFNAKLDAAAVDSSFYPTDDNYWLLDI